MGICGSRARPTNYAYVTSRDSYEGEAQERNVPRLDDKPTQQGQNEGGENNHNEREQQAGKEIDQGEARRREEELKQLQLEGNLYRKKLVGYKFGVNTGQNKNLFTNITQLRIGVFGPTASGKTSFVNTCERALRETEEGHALESTPGDEWTTRPQDYLPEMFFHLVDTIGFSNFDFNESAEFKNILNGKIQPGDAIAHPSDRQIYLQKLTRFPLFEKRVHGVIIVVKANDPRLTNGEFKEYLQPVRDILRNRGMTPTTVVTHCDTLRTEENSMTALNEASEAVGSSPSSTYLIRNYTKENRTRDLEIELMALKILHSAVIGAERAVAKIVTGTVPREILQRAPMAFEAHDKAHCEGSTVVKRVPIIFTGQHRSGKTSVKNSLRGQPFKVNEDSIAGKDENSSSFKMSREIWKVGEKDKDANYDSAFSFEHYLARSTVQYLRYRTIELEPRGAISSESSNPKHISNSPESKFTASDVTHTEIHDPDMTTEMPKDHQPGEKPESSENFTNTAHGVSDDSKSEEFLRSLTEVLLQMEVEEEDLYSMLWDFNGESINHTTYPVFLTHKAVYILVYDLSQNATAIAKPVIKQGRYREREDSHFSKTNLDYLKFWMSSVASSASQHVNNPSNSISEVLPEKLPPVLLVFTHADTLGDDVDARKIVRDVYGSLKQTPSGVHLYKDFFVVDTTKSGQEFECSEIVRLRKEVLAVCSELPQLRETIPIQSLIFEKAIQKKKEEGHKFVSLEDARLLAFEECNISDEKQFQRAINFLHDQRILIHFDETPELNRLVILDFEWLLNVFKGVMSVKLYEGSENIFEHLWRKLETEGILEENLLEYVWGPLHDKRNTYESLLAIMEKFSLICPLPSLDHSCGKMYLVPSMLMSYPTEGITSLVAAARIPPIFLTFESGQVPSGLFLRIALQLVQWNRKNNPNSANFNFYSNYARFYPSVKEKCSVILRCYSSYIEVVVHGNNRNHESEDGSRSELDLRGQESFDENCARAVRRQLDIIVNSMLSKFFWPKNTTYRVSFMCPVCCQNGGIVKQCKFHLEQGCKQEECLHFLSESEICSADIIYCTRNAVAQEISVRKEQFEPWIKTISQQETSEEPVEAQVSLEQEGEEIVPQDLPPEIRDFLALPLRDTRGVYLKDLGEIKVILMTDPAFPRRSDPKTKKRIRSLARESVAKKRHDVLKHLRKITPAGSTGPSIPENTDVRNISYRRKKRLTEALSGGQDWKLLAEKLGLRADEIRFLDFRVKDPCEGALNRVASQGSLNVGDLYNYLVELGYPLIADEL